MLQKAFWEKLLSELNWVKEKLLVRKKYISEGKLGLLINFLKIKSLNVLKKLSSNENYFSKLVW